MHDEHQRQGSGTVTVRNIITSMRLISDVDWPELFERTSLVDHVLGETGSFRDMDFPPRYLYRGAIEELARGAGRTELDIARAAVLATKQAVSTPDTIEIERQGDPGYHLIAGGRPKFEAAIGFRAPLNTFVARRCQRLGIGGYVGAGITIAAVLLSIPLFILRAKGFGLGRLSLLGLVGTIPAIDVAVALVNRGVTLCFGATPLPALEFRGGVPAQLRTLVAVPTMLTTPEAIEAQIERLEVHYLASPDGDLHFALLSDWLDAAAERLDSDTALLDVAVAGVARLNRRHGPASGGDRFLLLHRKRVRNAGELRWIAWERKRGKLHELNELLRGATHTSFIDLNGQPPLNDGMNRVGELGQGESVWLGWLLYAALNAFAPLADQRQEPVRPTPGEPTPGRCKPRSKARAGMATGIGAPGSTMAPGSDRHPAPNAGSMRSRNPGLCSRARRIAERARPGHGRGRTRTDQAGRQLVLLFTPPLIRNRTIQDTSKVIRQVSAKIVANTRMPRYGPSGIRGIRRRRQGRRAVLHAQSRSTMRAPDRMCTVTRWNLMSSRLTSMPPRPMSAAVAGPGIPARVAGCSVPESRAFSAHAFSRICWHWTRAFQRHGRASR